MNHGVGADLDVGVDVGRGGIDQRDAGGHQFFVLLLSHHPADLGEFCPAVDAADLDGIRIVYVATDPPPAPVDGDQIGQVVLALGVVRADLLERVEQRLERERVDAGVDLLDLALRRRRIALLDDPRDPALRADDAAVAVGPLDDRRSAPLRPRRRRGAS